MKTCLKTRAGIDYDEESDEDEDKDSMKTVMKKMRRKREEEKKGKWMNMSKMKKLMKTIETSSIIETMMSIWTTSMIMKTMMKKMRRKTEEENKEKWMNIMSKMNKFMKTRARGDFEYNRNDDEY